MNTIRISRRSAPSVLGLAAALLLAPALAAQTPPAPKPEEFPAFETVIDGLTKVVSTLDGAPALYDLYSDKKTGRLVAVLPAAFEAQELMIACTITSGDPEAGVMGPTHYGHWQRIAKQLAFVVPNVNVRSEGDERAKAAVSSLYSASVLLSVPILALEGGARPVIDLGKLAGVRADMEFMAFKEGKITALVATDVAARGLDIDQLPLVVNYELPTNAEDYVHRIGRTGRAGASGEAISLVGGEEERRLVDIEKLLKREFPRERAAVSATPRATQGHRPARTAAPSHARKPAADDWFMKPYEPSPNVAKIEEQPSFGQDKPKKQLAALLCRPPEKS